MRWVVKWRLFGSNFKNWHIILFTLFLVICVFIEFLRCTLQPYREVSVLCANTSTAVQMSALVRLFRFEQGGNQATALLTPGIAIQENLFVDEFGNTCPISATFLQPVCCSRFSR